MKSGKTKAANKPTPKKKPVKGTMDERIVEGPMGVQGNQEEQRDLSVRGHGETEAGSDASARGAGNLSEHDIPSRRGEGGWDGLGR